MKRLLWIVCALLASGCLERELVTLNPCLVSGVAASIDAQSISKVDLLFVVDNSQSMAQEQQSLREQFPRLIRTLTSGTRSDGSTFPAVKDLHLGVVSTDMGLAGVSNRFMCDPANGGDDGKLLRAGRGSNCDDSYPKFLEFALGTSDPEATAAAFGCIATLGTAGCGYEQQLEAGLKALWPATYVDKDGNKFAGEKNPIKFLATATGSRFGHGDGANAGFLRTKADGDISLVAIVVVSDEEDCSSIKTDHFTSDPNNPISMEPPNLRCFNHKENLFKVERYIDGFKALRPGQEHLVIFAAIVGVPVELVDADARARFNDLLLDSDRAAYYEAILNDSSMVERPDGEPGMGANIVPSCLGQGGDNTAKAYPPVRIVQVARGFGANGVVQSICQRDFGPAMDAIIRAITDRLVAVCLPKPLIRKADGTVPCNVIWELPPKADAAPNVPTECGGDNPHLEPVDQGRRPTNDRGGNNCKVKQLPVERRTVPEGRGWYYDDFADELERQCPGREQRVSFTESAKPENGVTVKLECVNETQQLPSSDPRRMAQQPFIGKACGDAVDSDDEPVDPADACLVRFKDGTEDRSMFCHPELNVCVKRCQGKSDCPAAWVCDDRRDITSKTDGRAFCVNPTCGSD